MESGCAYLHAVDEESSKLGSRTRLSAEVEDALELDVLELEDMLEVEVEVEGLDVEDEIVEDMLEIEVLDVEDGVTKSEVEVEVEL